MLACFQSAYLGTFPSIFKRMGESHVIAVSFIDDHMLSVTLCSHLTASDDEQLREPAETTSSFSDVESFTRLICGALIMPTVATMSGKLLFKRVSSNFQRTLLVCSGLLDNHFS